MSDEYIKIGSIRSKNIFVHKKAFMVTPARNPNMKYYTHDVNKAIGICEKKRRKPLF